MVRKSCIFVLAAGLLAAPASAQLIVERVDGVRRICVYAGAGNLLDGGRGAVAHRVGLAETCPATPPAPSTSFDAPPTAALVSDINLPGARRCVYEQGSQQWVFDIAPQRYCPLGPGTLVEERRRFTRR